jgi:hypothetical protein
MHRMIRYIFSAGLFIFLINEAAGQQKEWKLLYHHDKHGLAIEGELSNLIRAIRDGEHIRIYWIHQHSPNKKIKVEHAADAKFLTIVSGSVVYAQIDPIDGQIPDFDSLAITLKKDLSWTLIAGTNGKHDTITREISTGKMTEYKSYTWEVKWFAMKKL